MINLDKILKDVTEKADPLIDRGINERTNIINTNMLTPQPVSVPIPTPISYVVYRLNVVYILWYTYTSTLLTHFVVSEKLHIT